MFDELPVLSNTVLIITVCLKVANSTFLVTNKRTKWAELSRYYLDNYTPYRARQLYKNISMLFLFPVKDGKRSTGVNATFNALC